ALGADVQRRWNRQLCPSEQGVRQRLDGGERASMQRLGQGQHPVEIDLRGREGAVELRLASESQAGSALELDRPFVRPVLKLDLLQDGGGAVSLDVAGDTPRLDDHRAGTRGRAANRARQLNGALEAPQATP